MKMAFCPSSLPHKGMKHGVGHEGILIAMDKEHRFGALANLSICCASANDQP